MCKGYQIANEWVLGHTNWLRFNRSLSKHSGGCFYAASLMPLIIPGSV